LRYCSGSERIVQGDLASRPLPVDDFTALLAREGFLLPLEEMGFSFVQPGEKE